MALHQDGFPRNGSREGLSFPAGSLHFPCPREFFTSGVSPQSHLGVMRSQDSTANLALLLQTQTPSSLSPVIFSPNELRLHPVTLQPVSSPDYFNLAASLGDDEYGVNSKGWAVDPLRDGVPSAGSGGLFANAEQSPHNVGMDNSKAEIFLFPRPYPDDQPLYDTLCYSPGSSSSPSIASSCDEAHETFLKLQDRIILSPRQNIILQEAHQEAQRRAVGSCTSPELLPPESAFASVTAYSWPLDNDPLSQEPSDASHSKKQELSPQANSLTPPAAPISIGNHASVTPVPITPASNTTSTDNSPVACNESAVKTTSEIGVPCSPKSCKGGTIIKAKQLGSFPADEAFATSLNQLNDNGENQKPAYLWWTLIRAAILGSPEGRLQMETLCSAILEKFP